MEKLKEKEGEMKRRIRTSKLLQVIYIIILYYIILFMYFYALLLTPAFYVTAETDRPVKMIAGHFDNYTHTLQRNGVEDLVIRSIR